MPPVKQEITINRRSFLKMALMAGSAISVSPFLRACERLGIVSPTGTPTVTQLSITAVSSPHPTATVSPTPTEEAGTARLAFVKTRDRAQGIRQALDILGINPVQGKQMLLKPNFNSADPAPASTHPTTLRTIVEILWEKGAQKITVADRSGMGNSRAVMQTLGVFALAKELGFETLSFEDLQAEKDWELTQPADSHWQNGFPFARPCLEAEALVSTCCLKPHRFGGHFTMSLKNSVGMVGKYLGGGGYNYMNELHASPYQRLMIAEVNSAYTPAFVVLDGVEAFIDAGPNIGTKVWGDAVIAGTDRIAIDAVGLALLRFLGYTGVAAQGLIFQQEQISRAVELGLGVNAPEKIHLATANDESKTYAAQIQEVLLRG